MQVRFSIITLILALIVSQSPMILAQNAGPHQDWNIVKAEDPGTNVRVETKDGERIDGKISGVTDTALTLTVKGRQTTFDRTSIGKVFRVKNGSRTKSILIGTGIGAGVGFGAGGAALGATGGSDRTSAVFGAFALAGAGVGAAVGAALGGGTKRTLIYEAK